MNWKEIRKSIGIAILITAGFGIALTGGLAAFMWLFVHSPTTLGILLILFLFIVVTALVHDVRMDKKKLDELTK